MAVLCDRDIRKLCDYWTGIGLAADSRPDKPPDEWKPMIHPFSEAVSGDGAISYGLTSAGYDLRLSSGGILVFKNTGGMPINPKRFKDPAYRKRVFDEVMPDEDGAYTIPPGNGYVLGMSVEYMHIPRWLKGRCVGKSTLARSGVLINTTPLEPGWHGTLTIEIGNVTNSPVQVFANEGIAQLEFETLSGEPETDYAAKSGQYQGQTSVTPARVK